MTFLTDVIQVETTQNGNALELRFSRPVTDDDRKSLMDAHNAALNTRPAAPVEGLETIVKKAMQDEWEEICADTGCHPLDIEQLGRRRLRFSPNHWASAVAASVRSQAEAIIAAERAETERWHKKAMDAGVIVHSDGTTSHPMRKERDDLKADNAALTARVKVQTEHIATLDSNLEAMERRAKEGETQLAAARKALERADDALQLEATASGHTYVKIALGEVRS